MAKKNTYPNILATHPAFEEVLPMWNQILDVLGGECSVKARCRVDQRYLPLPAVEADEQANRDRYKAYLTRAVFYNASARTLAGIVGQVFSKAPVTEFPETVDYLLKDPAGTGVTLEQSAKRVLRDIMSLGRAGLWVDYPVAPNGATVKEINAKKIRPVITAYRPTAIRNWRTKMRGAQTILSLVVLEETYILSDDGFETIEAKQYRELSLDENDQYRVRIWRVAPKRSYEPSGYIYPKDSEGNPFSEIPFVFIGIQDNDSSVDDPPMYDLSVLNLAHFRNSADYEEACFMVGQPTPWFSGLTDEWVQNTMKGRIFLGSRGGIPLPAGGAAGLLTVPENGLVKEAMDQKEEQMVALGARLVQDSTVTKTATEVSNDKVTEVSTLAAAARNTSAGFMRAFEFCSMYSGNKAKVSFELSTDFDMARMTSQELLAVFTVWQGRLLTSKEARDILRRAGYATEKFDQAVEEGVLAKPPEPVVNTPSPTDGGTNKQDNRSQPAKS